MTYETRLIWVLTITFGLVFLDRNAASFVMPFIANDLHFNNSQVGLVASALSFTWAVAAFLGGAYSDRTGNRKNLLLITVVAFSLCSFASGLAVSFVTLFSTRLLMGLAEGPILPISQSLVAIESTAAKRGNNMGVMQNFGSNLLGSFVAPLVLVAVASTYNWRWAFYLSGLPGLIIALLIAKFVRQPAAPATLARPSAQTAAPLAETSMGYREMLRHRNMWLCMLMAIFMVAWMVLGWASAAVLYKGPADQQRPDEHTDERARPVSCLLQLRGAGALGPIRAAPCHRLFQFHRIAGSARRAVFPGFAILAGRANFHRLVCQRHLSAVHGHGAVGNHSGSLRSDFARHGGGAG